jgi:hypothetical protein
VKVAVPKGMTEDAARRYVANRLRAVLERDDLERRVKEAEATLAELKPALERAQAAEKKENAVDAGKGRGGAEP